MANQDDERREMPRDLYPEWTTHPSRTKATAGAVIDRPVRGPALEPPMSRRRFWVLGLVVLGALVAVLFMVRERARVRSAPRDNAALYAPDTQLEDAARARLANEDLHDADVTIVVREQVVTVSGRVPDAATREKVLNVVRMTPNVTGVIDHLNVGEPDKRPEPGKR